VTKTLEVGRGRTVIRNINSAAFLQRRTARDARQIQWGIRYSF
jgi:hypothetical protein